MPLQASVHVKDGNVSGAYASQAKNVGYDDTNVEVALDSIMPRTATGTTLAQLVTAIGKLSEEQKSRCIIKINYSSRYLYLRRFNNTVWHEVSLSMSSSTGTIYEYYFDLNLQKFKYSYTTGTTTSIGSDLSVTDWTLYYQGTPID